MRRTDRLFELIQLFRSGRTWRGEDLAAEMGVSVRTIYRDIETLVASGVPIEGARGVGYILRAPIFLPPLTLDASELAALQFGVAVAEQAGDADLARGAGRLRTKIQAVIPEERRRQDYLSGLTVRMPASAGLEDRLHTLRQAVARQLVLDLDYTDLGDQRTRRSVRPLNVEYWGHVWTTTTWCELRQAFRVFRVDRMIACHINGRVFAAEPGKRYRDYLKTFESSLSGPKAARISEQG